jgi:hypothetical protein
VIDFKQIDKQGHFFAGGCIASAVAAVAVPHLNRVGFVLAFFAAAIVGVCKELWDGHHTGHVKDWDDARATALGALVMTAWLFAWS